MLLQRLTPPSTSPTSTSYRGVAAQAVFGRVHRCQVHRPLAPCSVSVASRPASTASEVASAQAVKRDELNQYIRQGHYETALVDAQARKKDDSQASIASSLQPADSQQQFDVAVVGAGPSGLYLAAQLAQRGLDVAVLGLDVPIVNNYGVWTDEFEALGLQHTLEVSWPDAVCYFGEGKEVRVGRGYGRVSRRKLREHLVNLCRDAGVKFASAEVTAIKTIKDGQLTQLTTADGTVFKSRLTTLAAGAAAGKFLQYEEDAPVVAAQTAYGIEAEVEGYDGAYPENLMVFMDFRRHHSGLYDNTVQQVQQGAHPNAGDGLWGTSEEAPSFLYAMPLGGNRVFLEETCLVAKPAVPFAVLKRRLTRRLKALGISVTKIHEEEWSYIPVGGPLPISSQLVTAFGAAANLIHPATGFSVSRSFREAPIVADEIVNALKQNLGVAAASKRVWDALWPQEKRTQATFHVFGMELLATLDLQATNSFFDTFFRLPSYFWRGFLASTLSSMQLINFALFTFVLASFDIKYRLINHLITDPAGKYLVRAYKAQWSANQEQDSPSAAMAVACMCLSARVSAQAVQSFLDSSC